MCVQKFNFTYLNRVIIRCLFSSLSIKVTVVAINWHSYASLFHQSCLNIKRRVQILSQCLKSYRSVDVGRSGRFRWQWLALWHWSRCPPRGLSRRRCVWVPLSCSHHPICNYTQRACALHTAQAGTKDYWCIVLYCPFTVCFWISLLLFYTFKLISVEKRFRWKGKVCTLKRILTFSTP